MVGKRGRSQFLTEIAGRELERRRQKAAVHAAFGAWKDNDHPELKDGVDAYVRKLRDEGEVRFKKQFAGK